MNPIDLTQLPPPEVIETLDFEAVYQELLDSFRELMGNGWDAELESDPVVKLLELAAYRELLIRARINDAARANLLAFAGGADLDQLGAFYQCARLEGEDDTRYRLRLQLRIAALAGHGTREHYRLAALGVSLDVVDATVLTPVPGRVEVALWAREGINALEVLAEVQQALGAEDARMLGVPVTVRLAQARPIDVAARIYREASAPVDLAAQLGAALPEQLRSYSKLGRDVPRSWLLSKLHVAGVARVELITPAADLVLGADDYVVAGTVTVEDGGVAW